jgi:hypothetical protein
MTKAQCLREIRKVKGWENAGLIVSQRKAFWEIKAYCEVLYYWDKYVAVFHSNKPNCYRALVAAVRALGDEP